MFFMFQDVLNTTKTHLRVYLMGYIEACQTEETTPKRSLVHRAADSDQDKCTQPLTINNLSCFKFQPIKVVDKCPHEILEAYLRQG